MKRHIPNILTIGRLVLTLVMFGALVGAASFRPGDPAAGPLLMTAFVTFVIAAVTDFFDGALARRWNVVSTMGAILDPIADKVLVCAAIVGLLGIGALSVLVPGGLILFREFSVSALREVLAPKGLKLPVTFLAKTKTALQLVFLGGYLGLLALDASTGGSMDLTTLANIVTAGFLVAAGVTVWTGVEYALAARKALRASS